MKVELVGIGGYGAALYCGTGCLHRRESLYGKVYSKDYGGELNVEFKKNADKAVNELEEVSKFLANCNYEKDTQWGKKVSLSISACVCMHAHMCIRNFYLENCNYEFADGSDLWVPGRRYCNWLGYPMQGLEITLL